MNDFREGFSAIPRHLFGMLTAYELAVVAAIHSRYPNAYPSLDLLAHDAGMSRSSVQRTLNTLKEKGLVRIENRQDQGRSSIYILTDVFFRGVGHSDPRGRSHRPEGVGHSDQRSRTRGSRTKKSGLALRAMEDDVRQVSMPDNDPMSDLPQRRKKSDPDRVERGTYAWVRNHFSNRARYLGIRDFNRGHLSTLVSSLLEEYTHDEVCILIDVFFSKHEVDIRAKSSEYDVVRLFHQQINQGLKKQAASQIQRHRRGPRQSMQESLKEQLRARPTA